MSDISYTPARKGGWMLLSRGSLLLAIAEPPESPRVGELWDVMSRGADAGAVLDEVIRTGISKAPAFVLVDAAEPRTTRVLVRGLIPIRTSDGSTVREVSGEGVSSWTEQIVDTTSGFEVGSPAMADGTSGLPLVVGVVWAAAFRQGQLVASVEAGPPASIEYAPVESPRAPESVPLPPPVDIEQTLAGQTISTTPAATVPLPPEVGSEPTGYDHLFGETVFRNVEDAAIRPDDVSTDEHAVGPPPVASEAGGDHDGHTVMVSDMAALRAKRRAARGAPAAAEVSAPTLFVDLSTGGREVLDQPLVIGRAPAASRVPGGKVPRLVIMNTPNQDISRTHVQITADGGTVVVTDLHSSNGTMITLPGRPAQKLRPGEPATVIVGTVIDLGDGATLTLGELS